MHAIAPAPTPAPSAPSEDWLRRRDALREEYAAGFDAPPAEPGDEQ